MSGLDWNAEATLHERDDAGSEMQYNFSVLKKAPLRDLVAEVAAMDAAKRARLVIDVAGGKSLNVSEILEIAAREGLK
ncbi:hypothetical protein [Novosphingobium taihuense]|uniref:Uncharacterized protein n=1 Tax=Novosphingobium taihuense TaxID=260085 RepID=A0A7W7EU33_9SPHN|nr:hypothetical protein [Novosphingobium taihuense]MBB4613654.1 hypothetical protein [Novosphingobium taihuense]TWH81103.1 hypothetical protein IQ25_03490 [Novosphingobium taihuense]